MIPIIVLIILIVVICVRAAVRDYDDKKVWDSLTREEQIRMKYQSGMFNTFKHFKLKD